MTRTITSVSELDALPVGSVIMCDDERGVAKRVDTDIYDGYDWLVVGSDEYRETHEMTWVLPATVLHDPSAPVVPVVSDAAVEAARTAARLHSTTEPPPHENREVCCGECGEAIAYPGCTAAETAERAWRHTYRAALTAALPFLAAAPSATLEEVGEALHPGLFSLSDYEYARRFDNHGEGARAQHQEAVLVDEVDPLLARFTITPRTDR